VINAIKHGYTHFFIPAENIHELEYVHNITIYPLNNFEDIVAYFLENKEIPQDAEAKNIHDLMIHHHYEASFEHIKGQLLAKRALSIAAAGLHNLLMVGGPGCGKTMLSKALHSILPPLAFEEILEVSQIYSVVGKLTKDQPLIIQIPFRQIHHTASKISIVGGGSQLTPGEVSLAHK
jgi:magnesium chelatase family protein